MSIADELQAAMQAKFVPDRNQLRRMCNRGEWSKIGNIFGFEPKYCTIGNKVYFNWQSCNPEFWAVWMKPKNVGRPMKPTPVVRKRGKGKGISKAEKLYRSQKSICYLCGELTMRQAWTVEHKIPLARGGSKSSENLAGACYTCNHAKGHLTEEEFRKCDPRHRKQLLKDTLKYLNLR